MKHRFSQHTPDHHGESCSRETLDDFAKTRQILWGLEHQLADLSEAIEVEKQVESGHVPSAPEPKSIGNKWGTKSPQLYFKLEVCQCNFSSVTETSPLPLCLFHPLEPSMGFDFCLALDSDKIHIKRVVAVKFTVATSSTNELVLMPVDRQAGPQETLIRYFGRFTSLRTMATVYGNNP